jgi:hypothetical protein
MRVDTHGATTVAVGGFDADRVFLVACLQSIQRRGTVPSPRKSSFAQIAIGEEVGARLYDRGVTGAQSIF